jgi:hypothetical protein
MSQDDRRRLEQIECKVFLYGYGTMSTRYETDLSARKVQLDASTGPMDDACDRILTNCDRIDALLQSILDSIAGSPTCDRTNRGFGVVEDR